MLGNSGLSIFGDDRSAENLLAAQGAVGTTYYVATTGSDSNSGESWAKAKLTIQAALDLCSGRGLHRVYVASGGYSGTLQTPLNTPAPFGQLIGLNHTDMAYGPWLTSAAAGEAILTIRARGWRISGFEFDLPVGASAAAAIVLDKQTSGCSADYTQIDHCFFSGGQNSRIAIDFKNNVNYAVIDNCEFEHIYNASGTGEAIGSSYSSTAVSGRLRITNNIFKGNDKHIHFNGNRGCQWSLIENNLLVNTSAKTATQYCNLAGGAGYNVVRRNICAGTWSHAGGYTDAANDIWAENYQVDGALKTTQPS